MAGTSNPIEIPTQKFAKRYAVKLSPTSTVKMTVVGKEAELSAPILNDDNSNYASSVNVFPYFAFDKLSRPYYGVLTQHNDKVLLPLAKVTAMPYSSDFIKDYHLISLFRLADKLTTPEYSGKIKEQFETPSSNT